MYRVTKPPSQNKLQPQLTNSIINLKTPMPMQIILRLIHTTDYLSIFIFHNTTHSATQYCCKDYKYECGVFDVHAKGKRLWQTFDLRFVFIRCVCNVTPLVSKFPEVRCTLGNFSIQYISSVSVNV